MNAQQPGVQDSAAPHPWRAAVICFVLLYCPLLAFVFATMSFSEEDIARHYIAETARRPPAPLPPLPVLHFIEWPDVAMRRDPFQPLVISTERASSKSEPLAAAGDTPAFRLLASYQDAGKPYAIGRGATGELARFGVGDKVDGGEIERIDPDRVVLHSGGQLRVIEIRGTEPGRVQ